MAHDFWHSKFMYWFLRMVNKLSFYIRKKQGKGGPLWTMK